MASEKDESSMAATAASDKEQVDGDAVPNPPNPPNMSLKDITNGDNGRGIPAALFIDDITAFSESFSPQPAQAELLIGAYTQLHTKYKSSEASLLGKRMFVRWE